MNARRVHFRGEGGHEGHLRYTRWPIAGLTFQLAADNIETGIVPTRDDIEREPAPQSSGRSSTISWSATSRNPRKLQDDLEGKAPAHIT
jgi:hypothetical protein